MNDSCRIWTNHVPYINESYHISLTNHIETNEIWMAHAIHILDMSNHVPYINESYHISLIRVWYEWLMPQMKETCAIYKRVRAHIKSEAASSVSLVRDSWLVRDSSSDRVLHVTHQNGSCIISIASSWLVIRSWLVIGQGPSCDTSKRAKLYTPCEKYSVLSVSIM